MISLGVYDIPGDIRNYLTYKNVYADYRKNRNKDKFYEEHRAELSLYDTALRTPKEKASKNKLPSMIAVLSLAASSRFLATKKARSSNLSIREPDISFSADRIFFIILPLF